MFYRVSNIHTNQGLWYDHYGKFTGLIHSKFNFCTNSTLEMPYDKNVLGFLSTTGSLDALYTWFNEEDIRKLQEFGYFIHEYKAENYRFYNNHWIINQDSSILTKRIQLL